MQKKSKEVKLLSPLFNGFINSILCSIVLIIIVSLIFHFSSLSEMHLHNFSNLIIVLSVFWGGYKSASQAESRALFHGLGVGGLYLIAMVFLTILISEPLNLKMFLLKALYCSGSGIVGSIIGASFK